jgi:hypothetical protein
MDEGHARRDHERFAVCLRIGVRVADEDDFRAHVADRVDFDLRRRLRHHDDGAEPELAGGVRDALGMIACACGDDAPGALVSRQVRDAVVRAPQLEAEDRLLILALEQDGVAQPSREPPRRVERRLACDVVHAARQDVVEKLVNQGVTSSAFRAVRKTAFIIAAVSLPVLVFCRLG